MKIHHHFPSRYEIGELVTLNFDGIIIKNCGVDAVKFNESKVRYDIHIPIGTGFTLIENVDSCFVEDNK